jgi:uncharacterized damage-inducible protein DinB
VGQGYLKCRETPTFHFKARSFGLDQYISFQTHLPYTCMRPSLHKQIKALQDAKNTLLNELAGLRPEQLLNKPAPDAWSPLQVVAHLVIVEQRSCDYMEKKIKGLSELKPIGFKEKFNLMLLRTSLALPLKFKAPAPVRDVPDVPQLSIIAEQWEEVRGRLNRVLDAIPEQDLHKPIFKHPYSGPMDAAGLLLFIESHFNHHLPQIHSRIK